MHLSNLSTIAFAGFYFKAQGKQNSTLIESQLIHSGFVIFQNIEIQECVDAYVVVYAIDDASTFEFAKRVLLVLRDSIQENSLPPAGFILVGNKFDLVRGREVSAEGMQFFQK